MEIKSFSQIKPEVRQTYMYILKNNKWESDSFSYDKRGTPKYHAILRDGFIGAITYGYEIDNTYVLSVMYRNPNVSKIISQAEIFVALLDLYKE